MVHDPPEHVTVPEKKFVVVGLVPIGFSVTVPVVELVRVMVPETATPPTEPET